MLYYVLCGGMILIIIAIVCYYSPSPIPRGKCDNCRFYMDIPRHTDKQNCRNRLTEYDCIEQIYGKCPQWDWNGEK